MMFFTPPDSKRTTRGRKNRAEMWNCPPKYQDHALAGDYRGHRECHIQPDWLLIYKINDRELLLTLTRTGTHSELFDK